MIIQETGSMLIGFSKSLPCLHCRNVTPMQVRQNYLKQSFVFIPFGTSHFPAFLQCPKCENKIDIDDSKGLFLSKDYKNKVIDLLDGGKHLTKSWFSQLDQKEQEHVLKRLNTFKAYSIVKYIAGES